MNNSSVAVEFKIQYEAEKSRGKTEKSSWLCTTFHVVLEILPQLQSVKAV